MAEGHQFVVPIADEDILFRTVASHKFLTSPLTPNQGRNTYMTHVILEGENILIMHMSGLVGKKLRLHHGTVLGLFHAPLIQL